MALTVLGCQGGSTPARHLPVMRLDGTVLLEGRSLPTTLGLAGNPEPLWQDLWAGDAKRQSGDEQRALVVAAAMLGLARCPDPTLTAGSS